MTRSKNTAPLMDEAFEAWLAPVSDGGEGNPSQGEPAPGSDPVSEERLIERALSGHSPSARALANAGDSLVAIAELAGTERMPTASLRDRILRDVSTIPPPTFRSSESGTIPVEARPASVVPLFAKSAPNEALGKLHAAHADEPRRIEIVERHGMRGGLGQEETDRALHLLIDQYSPFLGFEVVFVSTVVGDVTIHRVHRGFPAEFGNIDIVARELSFCTHTVSSAEPVIVEDAAKEAFFRQSDLVQKFGCRAYLGVPLFADDPRGRVALGALCGISFSPQVIFPEDVSLAQRFARIAQALVTHDEAELSRLIVEPTRYPVPLLPGSSEQSQPIVLSSEAFSSIVEAQRQRIGAASSTWLVHVPRAQWAEVSPTLPTSVIAGVAAAAGGEEGRAVLIPEDHPDFSKVQGLVERGERLG